MDTIVYRERGSLMWSTPVLSFTFGMPFSVPGSLAEILISEESIYLRSMEWDKFTFHKSEVTLKPVFAYPVGYGFQLVHQKEDYPERIIFGFGFNQDKRTVCRTALEDIGVKVLLSE